MADDFYRSLALQMMGPKPDGYNPYSAGTKIYGGGRSNPTSGPVGNMDGYRERDIANSARGNVGRDPMQAANLKRQAALRYMQSQQQGRHMSPESLRGRV